MSRGNQTGVGQVHRQDQIVPIQCKYKDWDSGLAAKVADERNEPSYIQKRRYSPYGPPRVQGEEVAHNGDVIFRPRRGATSDRDGTAHVYAQANNMVIPIKFTQEQVAEYNQIKATKSAKQAKDYLHDLQDLYTMQEFIHMGISGVTVRKDVNQQMAVAIGYGPVLIRNDGNKKVCRDELLVTIPPARAGNRAGYPDQGAGKDIARWRIMGYDEALEKYAHVLPKPSDAAAAEARNLVNVLESMEKGKKATLKEYKEIKESHRLMSYALGTGILEDMILGRALEDIFAGGQGHVGYHMRC